VNHQEARPERSEIAGRHIEQARAMYESAYNGRGFEIEPTEGDFAFKYTSVGDDELSLRGSFFGGSVRGAIETEGEYVVTWLTAGEAAYDLTGDVVGAYLERVASEHEGTPDGPLLFDTTYAPSGDALHKWAATVSSVARVIHSSSTSALLRSEANRAAAVSLLDTFPHESLSAPPELTIPNSARLRRAIEFMHANAHLPIAVTEIAEAAGISSRSLQTSFRTHLDLTPLDYLRRIRLDRVREELRAGHVDDITVAEVARRWGFAHLGRFAAHYAERFGELPRHTLAD
jgi:AraC-like DNA-binding protein